jgi:hypothetical protein
MIVSPSASCNQPQLLTFYSNSVNVIIQGNTWQINIGQVYGSPALIDSIQVNTQGPWVSGIVLLILFDANQQQIGQYPSQLSTGGALVFQNLPSTPISILLLQFLDNSQFNSYTVNIVVCSQTNTPSPPSILLFFSFSDLSFSSLFVLIYS